MKTFKCKCGADIYVDDDKYDVVKNDPWSCAGAERVRARLKRFGTIYLVHQVVPYPAPDGMIWDHKDLNIHNNLSENLRLANPKQSSWNRGLRKDSKSGYKGVTETQWKGVWRVRIMKDGVHIHLGYFENIEQAAVAYNDAALKHFGEFACLNVLPWPNSVFQGPPKQSDIPRPMMQITE